jgi:LmbE family N-acetylglucosaminyl deacetylase
MIEPLISLQENPLKRPAIAFFLFFSFVTTFTVSAQQAPTAPAVREPDDRFKADILVVVAHPDDEGAATPYLARAVDEGKRVAVVYGTRGGSGANEASSENAAALAAIREIEARRACATLGITNVWFLGGKDTASQNVLQSLANWGHGAALEQAVRLVRLTRPEVILTFFPGVFIGENHGDHQAAGVIASEAFDLAGDPAAFPSQVAGPTKRLEPFLENLHPWQPKKIYYFGEGGHDAEFKNSGPSYSVREISKSRKMPYWRIALESFRAHETQAKSFLDSLGKMSEAEIEKMATGPDGWADAQTFTLGKSLVPGSMTGDIFEGISSAPAAAAARVVASAPAPAQLSIELGGPWSFYREFRRAHGLDRLPQIAVPEIAVLAPGSLQIPLWLRNGTPDAKDITLSVTLPSGWSVQDGAGRYTLRTGEIAPARIEINLPALPEKSSGPGEPSEVSVRAEAYGQTIGVIKLRVELRKRALPQ